MTKMTTEEAFVKVLQKHGIAHVWHYWLCNDANF